MDTDTEYLIERFLLATYATNLSSMPITINRASGVSRTYSSHALDVIIAAGFTRGIGTSLLRLKYGNDASEYRGVLEKFGRMAVEESRRLRWGDEELTTLMAEFVLDAWLINRPLMTKGKWIGRTVVLFALLKDEERKTCAGMIAALK